MGEKNKKGQEGFTLIELIIAVAILVMACIPLLQSFIVSSRMNVMGRQKEQAMTVAENVCEGIKAVGPQSAYIWAEKAETNGVTDEEVIALGYNIIPVNTGMTVSATSKTADTRTGNFSNLEKPNSTEKLGSAYASVSYADLDIYVHTFKLNNILLGKTYYDATVVMTQDLSDSETALATILYKDLFSKYNVDVMKYFNIEVKVSLHGSADTLATYTGSAITKY